MAQEDGAIYIVTLNGGLCVEKRPEGLKGNDTNGEKTQKWTVQYGENENEIAFQNTGNGEWLFMTKGAQWAKCDTSTTKQWWTLRKGETPGSCWIENNTYPGFFLCNLRGNATTNNVIHAWNKEMNWLKTLLWYFKDANGSGFSPKECKPVSAGDGEDLKRREDAVVKKEQEIAAKEVEQKKFEAELAAKEITLNDLRQSATEADQEKSAGNALANGQPQPDDVRENEERDYTAKEAAAKEAAAKEAAAKEAAASEREKQALKKEGELKKIAAKLKAENARLLEQLKRASLQQKVAESKTCHHKLYPPPKKLERRVVGFLYE